MPQKKQKTSKAEISLLYHKCQYCQAHQTMHFFYWHESACKVQWIIHNENQQTHNPTLTPTTMESAGAVQGGFMSGEFMEGCNTMQTEDTIVETDLLDMPWAGDAEEPIPSEQIQTINACWY